MAASIQEIRATLPGLSGLTDAEVIGVLQRNYYPDATEAELAKEVGVEMPAPPQEERSLLRTAGDYGITALKGAIGVPEAAVGLADIATGGRAGKALENIGFRPKEAKAMLDEQYSDQQKQAFRNFQDADGFTGKAVALWDNPSVAAHSVVESLPMMGAGGLAGRGLAAVGSRAVGGAAGGVGPAMPGYLARVVGTRSAPMVAGALGEGVAGAGSAAEQIRQETQDGTLSAQQVGLSALSGAGTAAFGLLGGKVAQKLGFADVDTMLASASRDVATQRGVVRRMLEGAASEGLLEELPQSIHEQVAQNAALGRPLEEGVDGAAILGAVSGGLMGAGGNALARRTESRATTTPALEQEQSPVTEAAPGMPPQPSQAQQESLSRMQALADEEAGAPDVQQAPIPDGAEILRAQREADMAFGRAQTSPDDEILGSTGKSNLIAEPKGALSRAANAVASVPIQEAPKAVEPSPADIVPEPLADTQAQINAVRDPSSGKDAALITPNSRAEVDTTGLMRVETRQGLLVTSNPEKAMLAQQSASTMTADQAGALLGYTTPKADTDGTVVQARDSQGNVIHEEVTNVANVEKAKARAERMKPNGGTINVTNAPAAMTERVAKLERDNANLTADLSGWSEADLRSQFQGATAPEVRQALAAELDFRRQTSEQTALQGELSLEQEGDVPGAEGADAVFASTTESVDETPPEVAQLADPVRDGDIRPDDIMNKQGKPFTVRLPAINAAKKAGDGYEVVSVDGGFVARKTSSVAGRDGAASAKVDRGEQQGQQPDSNANRVTTKAAAIARNLGDTITAAVKTPAARARRLLAESTRLESTAADQAKFPEMQRANREAAAMLRHAAEAAQGAEWAQFPEGMASLGMARADMPQIKAGDRSAFLQFLEARGMPYEKGEADPFTIKPTQADYSPKKVRAQADRIGESDRSVLVSSDGYVVDGHHQWLAHRDTGQPVQVIRIDAPVQQVLALAAEFPSVQSSDGAVAPVAANDEAMTAQLVKGGARLSRSPATQAAYESRIDALFAGDKPKPQGVRMLDRSDMLGLLGMSDGPVHLVESKVEQGRYNHNLTAADWKKVPDWLDNPVAVFDSETSPGRLVFIGPELVGGSPVRMIVDPRADGKGVNLMINAYDAKASPFARWARDGLLRYFDRQKATPVTGSFQPQLAGLPGERGRGKILTEKNLAGWRRANEFASSLGPQPASLSESSAKLVERVESEVEAIKGKWQNAPDVVVVSGMQDEKVPQAVRDHDAKQKSLGAQGEPEGFFYDGKVYLVASQMVAPRDTARVLMHEALGHYGMRGIFGDSLNSVLAQLVGVRRGETAAKARQYGLHGLSESQAESASVSDLLESMSDEQRMHAAEEVLAELAQTRPEIGFVRRAAAAIRTWLRENIPGFERLRMSDDEILRNFILPARGWVERGRDETSNKKTASADSIYFSRSADAAFGDGPALRAKAQQAITDLFQHDNTVSWWHKTVGTMQNMARRSPQFARVYDSVQNFINDVSAFASESADLAPNLLPKLETWRDITKSPVSAEDTKAIAAPVFEGTLVWARDVDGKLIKHADLEAMYENLSPEGKAEMLLRHRRVSEGQIKSWQNLPPESFNGAVRNRFESEFLSEGVVFTDSELRQQFKANDRQIELYREFRAAADHSLNRMAITELLRYGGDDVAAVREMALNANTADEAALLLRDHLLSLADDEPARRQVLIDTADKIMEKVDQINRLIKNGYAPLSRFGQYTLDVLDAKGERAYFGMFENKAEANRMARQMRENYPGGTVTQGTVSEQAYKLFSGVTPETLELFGEMVGLEASGDAASDQMFQEYLKLAKANRSAMKRLIHRKGIAGFSEDAGRVLAGFVYSNARLASTNLHTREISQSVADIPKESGQLKDMAVKLSEYVRNPQEEAQAIRGMMFTQYLGGSLASAAVNMTQPFVVTMPYLSQWGGAAKAAAQVKRALSDVLKRKTGDAKLDAALKKAELDGVVAPQEVHQLMAQARGSAALQSGDGTTMGDARAKARNAWSKAMLAWGKPFAAAEQFNRRMTYIAAYRTAADSGMADPDAFARKAIEDTQFVYNKGNKPQWARGAIGGTLFTFKQFSISYVELLHRLATQGGPEGRKAALFMLAMMFLVGGAGGLPFASDVEDVVDGVMQRLGYSWNTKNARKQLLTNLLGKPGAEFVENGISGISGMPIDVAGRLGMGNLIPGTGLLTQKQDHSRDILEFAGPAGDLGKRLFAGADAIVSGNAKEGALQAMPTAVRNLAKGVDMWQTGMYRDMGGRKVIDTTAAEAIIKAIGFQPRSVADIQEATWTQKMLVDQNKLTRANVNDRMAKAIFEKDQEAMHDVSQFVRDWNQRNPSSPIEVNRQSVRRKVADMRRSKVERLERTSPKAIRSAVRSALTEGA